MPPGASKRVSRLALAWVVAGALFAVTGLIIGAVSQHEEFLETVGSGISVGQQAAAGNWVLVTGAIVALGSAVALVSLSRQPALRRVVPGLGVVLSVYALAALVQSAFVNVDALIDYRVARMSISPIVHDDSASPSVALGVMALFAAALLLLAACLDRLLLASPMASGRDWRGWWRNRPRGLGRLPGLLNWRSWPRPRARPLPGPPIGLSPEEALRRQAGATAIAMPFLVVAGLGSIRVLQHTGEEDPGAGLALILMPLAVLACMALLFLALAKAWHLASFVRNGRLADVAEEAWTGLGRAEVAAVGLLGAVALASTLLPTTFIDDLALGRTLVISVRAHGQGLVFVIVALIPGLLVHPHAVRCFNEYRGHSQTMELSGRHAVMIGLIATTSAGLLLGALTTFLTDGALWPWLATLFPATILAYVLGGKRHSVLLLLLLAWLLWAAGNSVSALFDGQGPVAGLDFATEPSILSLWRLMGAVALALAVARTAGAINRNRHPRTTIPITAGAALGAAAVCLLELPLSAWVVKAENVEYLGIGSVVASQAGVIATVMHAMALGFGALVAYCLARLHRPEWFVRLPPDPVGAPGPQPA